MIEDFQEGWEKEWFARGQNGRATFKLRSPQYQAPPDARLGVDIRSDKPGRLMLGMAKEKDRFHHSIKLDGDSKWRQVMLSPSDFNKRTGEAPTDWSGLDLSISPPAGWNWDDLKLRNLRWIKAGQHGDEYKMRMTAMLFFLLSVCTANATEKPNIIVIMVDDMGWSDLGCYGGEIDTPHIDSLATDGLRFTRFYNNAVCGATRASLLTGLYCQQTGHRGDRWNEPKNFKKCVLISELLQAGGYHTAMVGKWQGRDLAVKRGFNRFFGPNCQGKISYWNAVKDNDFYLDDKRWEFPNTGFFMTDAFNDHAVTFLEEAATGEKPFFLYVGYIAPHWPLHARDETIAPYRDRYRNQGWGDWRDARIKRQHETGLLPKNAKPAPVGKSIPDWSADPNKNWQAERMAVYAAQISNVDRGVGRMLEVLRNSGADKNTLILFLSDNGAAPNGGLAPTKSGFGFGPGSRNRGWKKDSIAIKPGSGPDLMPGPHDTFAGTESHGQQRATRLCAAISSRPTKVAFAHR